MREHQFHVDVRRPSMQLPPSSPSPSKLCLKKSARIVSFSLCSPPKDRSMYWLMAGFDAKMPLGASSSPQILTIGLRICGICVYLSMKTSAFGYSSSSRYHVWGGAYRIKSHVSLYFFDERVIKMKRTQKSFLPSFLPSFLILFLRLEYSPRLGRPNARQRVPPSCHRLDAGP